MSSQIRVDEHGYFIRDLPDGRRMMVYPITFDRARLSIGPQNSNFYDVTY